ncbi:MAG: HD domain-containing phosphohydrolase [Deltaproteobacteria bacterium]|nr:HD domain-containing phosphohydrolase [Deltaproteobacteria bacterium]
MGKLAIPTEILEKPGPLTEFEMSIIKSHTYYSYRVLESVPEMQTVNQWASFHHERLDGSGYPFHLTAKDLTLGSRIVAVADLVTALLEDRPYRKGFSPKEMFEILRNLVHEGAIDGRIVRIAESSIDLILQKISKLKEES